jgi:hypothetical protein
MMRLPVPSDPERLVSSRLTICRLAPLKAIVGLPPIPDGLKLTYGSRSISVC